MANSENITLETVKGKPVIGRLKNNWRQRDVTVYDHPTNPNMVVSVGVPFGSSEKDAVVCVEEREAFARVINLYPKTATYD
jgi:hypothetical protein